MRIDSTIRGMAIAFAVGIAGCGGGDAERERGNVVITPPAAAKSQPADEPAVAQPVVKHAAGDQPEAKPAAASDKPQPEMKQPAQNTEVAAAETSGKTKPEEATPAAAAGVGTAGGSAAKGTTFKGRVVVKGEPPPINPIIPSGNDPYCIDLGKIPNDEVIVGEGGGLANVFVWVRKVPSGVDVPEPPSEPAVLDQKNCRFVPHALICRVGQTLLVKNDDATLHNTRISGLTMSFNQTVAPNNRDGVPVDVNRVEIVPVPVKCDIHNWMSARILTTDNPWHTVTDPDGNFEINNLPSEVELEFRLQHGKAGYVERSLPLTLKEGEVKEQTFEIEAARLSD